MTNQFDHYCVFNHYFNSKKDCVFSHQEKQISASKTSPVNVPSQDNLISADSGKKSVSAEEIKPSSERTEITADEQTANAEPEETFRPSSEGKSMSLKQTEKIVL